MLMVLTVAAARQLLPERSLTGLRDDAIAAFVWLANWRFVAQKTDYFTQGAPPSPLQHTWSLGVEEQYYFVWPLLLIAVTLALAARARRRFTRATVGGVRFATFVIATVGALASAALAIVMVSDGTRDRIYFGTDTRAQALLVGASAAALLVRDWPSMNRGWCMIRTRWGRRAARILPLLGLAGLAAATHYATGASGEFRHGLLIGVAIAAVFVIAPVALEQRGVVARALALPPLVWLGTISYGVYLWHWPIFLALNGERTGWSGLPLFAARCAATVVLAAASYWVLEQPIRRWRPARVPLLPLAAATVASAAAVTLLVVPVGTGPGCASRACRPESPRSRPSRRRRPAKAGRGIPTGRSPYRCSGTRSGGRGCTTSRRRRDSRSSTTPSSDAAWCAAPRTGMWAKPSSSDPSATAGRSDGPGRSPRTNPTSRC
ncbi:acyltransferase family protein [Mycobacterium intracellulare]|nr:acyltransferase family protein [Mycobacterium intracellulare]